ncbi:hypothetical protein [Noviherbaspirillum aridicola]|uniref:DUF4148 domain-containing protein n=1 Tax=Noviherbaspirillum aridicola TaxID=2849687 RepID=A0ABQ4Q780_9BURK|nr:hypothetical protein [Noviherbaspirillum aridicola]GIZ53028.1 hypothetical protein NCCP691_30420 [Noviherbaspirillum aridicola]
MKIKNLIAVAAVLAAGSAIADDTYPYVDQSKFVGTKSRAEVRAELNGAPALAQRSPEFVEPTAAATAGKTRAEVQAELERDYARGVYASNRSPEFVEFTQVASTRSRDEVRQEAVAARNGAANGTSSGS